MGMHTFHFELPSFVPPARGCCPAKPGGACPSPLVEFLPPCAFCPSFLLHACTTSAFFQGPAVGCWGLLESQGRMDEHHSTFQRALLLTTSFIAHHTRNPLNPP